MTDETRTLVIPHFIWPEIEAFFNQRDCDLVKIPYTDAAGDDDPFYIISPRNMPSS